MQRRLSERRNDRQSELPSRRFERRQSGRDKGSMNQGEAENAYDRYWSKRHSYAAEAVLIDQYVPTHAPGVSLFHVVICDIRATANRSEGATLED